jgi:hypothetical protein
MSFNSESNKFLCAQYLVDSQYRLEQYREPANGTVNLQGLAVLRNVGTRDRPRFASVSVCLPKTVVFGFGLQTD